MLLPLCSFFARHRHVETLKPQHKKKGKERTPRLGKPVARDRPHSNSSSSSPSPHPPVSLPPFTSRAALPFCRTWRSSRPL